MNGWYVVELALVLDALDAESADAELAACGRRADIPAVRVVSWDLHAHRVNVAGGPDRYAGSVYLHMVAGGAEQAEAIAADAVHELGPAVFVVTVNPARVLDDREVVELLT